MQKTGESSPETTNLRKRAEKFPYKTPSDIKALSAEELKGVIEELRIHQVELEMQGEDLRRSHGRTGRRPQSVLGAV